MLANCFALAKRLVIVAGSQIQWPNASSRQRWRRAMLPALSADRLIPLAMAALVAYGVVACGAGLGTELGFHLQSASLSVAFVTVPWAIGAVLGFVAPRWVLRSRPSSSTRGRHLFARADADLASRSLMVVLFAVALLSVVALIAVESGEIWRAWIVRFWLWPPSVYRAATVAPLVCVALLLGILSAIAASLMVARTRFAYGENLGGTRLLFYAGIVGAVLAATGSRIASIPPIVQSCAAAILCAALASVRLAGQTEPVSIRRSAGRRVPWLTPTTLILAALLVIVGTRLSISPHATVILIGGVLVSWVMIRSSAWALPILVIQFLILAWPDAPESARLISVGAIALAGLTWCFSHAVRCAQSVQTGVVRVAVPSLVGVMVGSAIATGPVEPNAPRSVEFVASGGDCEIPVALEAGRGLAELDMQRSVGCWVAVDADACARASARSPRRMLDWLRRGNWILARDETSARWIGARVASEPRVEIAALPQSARFVVGVGAVSLVHRVMPVPNDAPLGAGRRRTP